MVNSKQSPLQECLKCGSLIDIGDEEPFALMHCPSCGAAARVRKQFGTFELEEILGAGGMGAVYRAKDVNLHRSVALKLLRREYTEDPEFVRQFEYEAAITAQINHPNVVKVFSTGSDHGQYYIAMELVDRGSLDDLITTQERVPEAQVLEVGIHIARGLHAAFEKGLIHRDVKPGNILFADASHAKIVDFGLAATMEQASTVGGEIWGTPYYVAPEKLDNKPEDFRSDIYSLGATLFHAVAGRPPYEAEDSSVIMLKHVKSQPVSLQAFAPEVSTATAYIINRTLNKEPGERYGSYLELIEHLQYAQSELQKKNSNRITRVVLRNVQSERAQSWITIGMFAAIALGGIAVFMFHDKIFGPSTDDRTIMEERAREAAALLNGDYQRARQYLIEKKYVEAATAFRNVDAAPDVPQPQRNWTTLHAGLAWLLAGQGEEARIDFKKLVERGPFSSDSSDRDLAEFFVKTAKLGMEGTPQEPSTEEAINKPGYRAFALLVQAARNWNAGNLEGAGGFFRQFQSATPDQPYAWIGDYKNLAGVFVGYITAYQTITERIQSAKTPEERKAALDVAREEAEKASFPARIAEKVQPLVADLERSVARDEEQMRITAEQDAADARALAPIRAKANALINQFRFAEARAVLSTAKAEGENGKRQKAGVVNKVDWLARFKATLIQDLSVNGYPAPVVRKGGSQIPGGVSRATDLQIEVKTPYGSVPIPWTDLSAECVYSMGRSFIRPDLSVERLADREWFLAAFAFLIGKEADGQVLATNAASRKPHYRQQLPVFLEFARK